MVGVNGSLETMLVVLTLLLLLLQRLLVGLLVVVCDEESDELQTTMGDQYWYFGKETKERNVMCKGNTRDGWLI